LQGFCPPRSIFFDDHTHYPQMKKISAIRFVSIMAAFCAAAGVHAQNTDTAISPAVGGAIDIAQLAADDQADRKHQPLLSQSELAQHDQTRRDQAFALVKAGSLVTSQNYRDAALIFQHGESPSEARLAFALAEIAKRLDPAAKDIAWLNAATWDRLMMRYKRPQWYGTQYVPSSDGKSWVLYEFDPTAIPDNDRRAAGVSNAAEIEKSFPRQERKTQ
jgi:hypothetical protein